MGLGFKRKSEWEGKGTLDPLFEKERICARVGQDNFWYPTKLVHKRTSPDPLEF